MKKSLTEAVVEYQETGKNWSELAERLYIYAYEFPGRETGWEHDECCDFLLSFCSRIPGLVQRYKNNKTFEAYFISTIKWSMRSFMEQQASQHFYIGWTAMESIRRLEFLPDVNPEQYGDYMNKNDYDRKTIPFETDSQGCIKKRSQRIRLLYITIRHAADVELVEIPNIARLTDVNFLWLDSILEKARSIIATKIKQRDYFRYQRNEYWYNLMRSKTRMLSAEQGSSMRNVEFWARKIHTWQKRYHVITQKLTALKVVVSHKDIGKLLNIPIGSIASGLYQIRHDLIRNNMDEKQKIVLKSNHEDYPGQRQYPQKRRISKDTDSAPNLYSRRIRH